MEKRRGIDMRLGGGGREGGGKRFKIRRAT